MSSSQLVPLYWSLISPNTFLLIFSIITWTARAFLMLSIPPASIFKWLAEKRSGTRSNCQCSPVRAIDNPLEVFWHICQEPPRVLPNSFPLEESKEGGGGRKVLIHSFNMLISPGAASVIAKLDTSKGNCFSKWRCLFQTLKTENKWI